MTELVLVKAAVPAAGVAGGLMFSLIAIDASFANVIRDAIGGAVTIAMGILAYKMAGLNKKMDSQAETIDQTLRKTEKIEGHVNSEKTKAEGEILTLQKENALLREIMADKKETAALLAQAVATQPILPQAPATLKEIEMHTGDTANNTAKTDAKTDAIVQEIKSNQ